jgi:Tetracyclin repressor-like, C-terminal domain/Enoyl-(Acyl carrier protein) reductase
LSPGIARHRPGARGYTCDVADLDRLGATVERVQVELGVPHVLIHNAVAATSANILEASVEDLERNFRVNTTSLFFLAQKLAPAMLDQDASLPGLERIDRHFAALGYDQNGCLIGNFTAELAQLDVFRKRLSRLWRQWLDELSACLAEGQRDGSVRTDVPASELARTVLALWEGAILSAKVERGPGPLNIARRTLRRLLGA